jgi:hypothetical protein
VTALSVIGPYMQTRHWGASSVALGIVLVGVVGAIVLVFIAIFDAYAGRLSQRLTRARPRWQYLLFALGYIGITVVVVMVGLHYRDGWPTSIASAFTMWSSMIALAMLGRGLSWGRARRAFWWHPPQWLGSGSAGADRRPGLRAR